jgi:plastocyanin
MTHHRRSFAVLVALALGTLSACGGSSGASSEPTKTVTNGAITVKAHDIGFDVGEIKTAPGPLTVTFQNTGAQLHDFKIDGTTLFLKANGGDTKTGTVTLTKGTYNFECTVPGHKQAGMKGTVVVG